MAHAGDAVIAWTGPKRPKSSATPDTGHVLTRPGLAWIAHRNPRIDSTEMAYHGSPSAPAVGYAERARNHEL